MKGTKMNAQVEQNPAVSANRQGTEQESKTKLGVFTGNLSEDQDWLFKTSQEYLGLSGVQAQKLCENFSTDYGRCMKESKSRVSISQKSKERKNNMATLKSVSKAAGVTLTYSLNTFLLLEEWQALNGSGIDIGLSTIVVVPALVEYFKGLE